MGASPRGGDALPNKGQPATPAPPNAVTVSASAPGAGRENAPTPCVPPRTGHTLDPLNPAAANSGRALAPDSNQPGGWAGAEVGKAPAGARSSRGLRRAPGGPRLAGGAPSRFCGPVPAKAWPCRSRHHPHPTRMASSITDLDEDGVEWTAPKAGSRGRPGRKSSSRTLADASCCPSHTLSPSFSLSQLTLMSSTFSPSTNMR